MRVNCSFFQMLFIRHCLFFQKINNLFSSVYALSFKCFITSIKHTNNVCEWCRRLILVNCIDLTGKLQFVLNESVNHLPRPFRLVIRGNVASTSYGSLLNKQFQ